MKSKQSPVWEYFKLKNHREPRSKLCHAVWRTTARPEFVNVPRRESTSSREERNAATYDPRSAS